MASFPTEKCNSLKFFETEDVARNDATVSILNEDVTSEKDAYERLLVNDCSITPSIPLATAASSLSSSSSSSAPSSCTAFSSSSASKSPTSTLQQDSAFYSKYVQDTSERLHRLQHSQKQDDEKKSTNNVSYMLLQSQPFCSQSPKDSNNLANIKWSASVRPTSTFLLTKANILKRLIIAATMLSALVFIFMAINIVFSSNLKDQQSQLYQQKHETVGKIDLNKYEHLQQRKVPSTPPKSIENSPSNSARIKTTSRDGLEPEWIKRNNHYRAFHKPTLRVASTSSSWLPKITAKPETNQPRSNSNYREVEFESDHEITQPEKEISSTASPDRPVEVPGNCTACVPQRFFAHYVRRGCSPVVSRTCGCTRYFRCPHKILPEAREGECEFDGKIYQLNEPIPMGDNCQVCRCMAPNSRHRKRHHNSTTLGMVDCSINVECPEIAHGVRAKPGCWFVYKPDQCCGQQVCHEEQPEVRCKYRDTVYRAGERFYLQEDPCKECVCDAKWNPYDPENSGSCRPVMCKEFARSHLLHRCTPIYRKYGCCPIDFLCGRRNSTTTTVTTTHDDSHEDDNLQRKRNRPDYRATIVPDETKTCSLNGRHFQIGEQVRYQQAAAYRKRTCASCKCQVPPLLTCQAESNCDDE